MSSLPHILADDGDVAAKLIFGVIAAIIWGVSALASWMNKQQQEAKRKQIRDTIQPVQRQMPPLPSQRRTQMASPPPTPRQIAEGLAYRHPEVLRQRAPVPPMRPRPISVPPLPPPVPARSRSMPPKLVPKPVARKRQQKQAIEQPILELSEESEPSTPRLAALSAIVPPIPAPRVPSVDASAIRQWLNPRTLRSQFILTELLQPPLALRERRD